MPIKRGFKTVDSQMGELIDRCTKAYAWKKRKIQKSKKSYLEKKAERLQAALDQVTK